MGEFNPELNVQDDLEYQENNIDFSEMIYIDRENLQNSDVILINSIIDGIYKNSYITDDKGIVGFNRNHKICNFAILTKNIEKFNRSFPNNVIDINGKSKEKLLRCIKWVLNKGRKNMEELDNIWILSDSHFFHGNIIKYCNRPWNSGKDSDGNIIVTQKDIEEIPALKDLRDAIEAVEKQEKQATGKKKFLLKKQLIEMRQDQYSIKSCYKQPIYSSNTIKSFIKANLDENITFDADGEPVSDGPISFFNPKHISALLCNYALLKEEAYGNFINAFYYTMEDLDTLVDNTLKDQYPFHAFLFFLPNASLLPYFPPIHFSF